MKRLLLVIGLPVALGLVWLAGERSGDGATVDVTVETDDVATLRATIHTQMSELGATRISEDTSYAEDGDSELTYRLPPKDLEDALSRLRLADGVVTDQRIAFDRGSESDSVETDLAGLDTCLDEVARDVSSGTVPSAESVARCQERVESMTQILQGAPQLGSLVTLNIAIERRSTTSLLLVVAVVFLAIGLATLAYLTLRSTREDDYVDLTDSRRTRQDDELYDRRN